jgi:guanine deaminase
VTDKILLGQVLSFGGNPMTHGLGVVRHETRGGVLLRNGLIAAVGEGAALRRETPHATVIDYGDGLILPGFVDCHLHYPQTRIIASWGKRLIDWLEGYTFPEEMRFGDQPYAEAVAEEFLDLVLAHGTTSLCSYCTVHPESVDALMRAADARGMRIAAGKVMMDRNAPEGLRDTPQQGYDDSKALIGRWHGRGRLSYAVTPRFAPTSSSEQLAAAGALWAEHPSCLMQTHLCEQVEEIAWVRELYPKDADYFGVYERFGLTGRGAIMGHVIHMNDREWRAMAASGSGIAHCPTSNTFIGSGLFRWDQAVEAGVPVGLATDIGGGSSFSMLRTMAATYEIGQLGGRALHPAELLWLATGGSAAVMQAGGKVGQFASGWEADLVVLDLQSTPAIAQRAARAGDIWEAVFPTIMMGDDRAIEAVWIAGKLVPNRRVEERQTR